VVTAALPLGHLIYNVAFGDTWSTTSLLLSAGCGSDFLSTGASAGRGHRWPFSSSAGSWPTQELRHATGRRAATAICGSGWPCAGCWNAC